MSYRAELDCPQCGAPVEFLETNHVISCSYCNVKNYLSSPMFHYVLPYKEMSADLIFVPYLRFKGTVYGCSQRAVHYKITDLTQRGIPLKALPNSLGVRPQATKLQFLSNQPGQLAKNFASVKEATKVITKQMAKKDASIHYQAFIGETVSLIYLAVARKKDKAYDAVSGSLIGALPQNNDIFEPVYDRGTRWQPAFIETLCPECGWNLDGEGDSVVLTCSQCNTVWRAKDNQFTKIQHAVIAGPESARYLPFWKMDVELKGSGINSYADFVRLTNQPIIIKKEWHNQKLSMWTAAFKVRPKIYLHLAQQLTVSQKEFDPIEAIPQCLQPVTLPIQEATESLPVVLAHSACHKKNILAKLKDIRVKVSAFSLVYMPFTEGQHDLLMEEFQLSINRKTLEYGRQL